MLGIGYTLLAGGSGDSGEISFHDVVDQEKVSQHFIVYLFFFIFFSFPNAPMAHVDVAVKPRAKATPARLHCILSVIQSGHLGFTRSEAFSWLATEVSLLSFLTRTKSCFFFLPLWSPFPSLSLSSAPSCVSESFVHLTCACVCPSIRPSYDVYLLYAVGHGLHSRSGSRWSTCAVWSRQKCSHSVFKQKYGCLSRVKLIQLFIYSSKSAKESTGSEV